MCYSVFAKHSIYKYLTIMHFLVIYVFLFKIHDFKHVTLSPVFKAK